MKGKARYLVYNGFVDPICEISKQYLEVHDEGILIQLLTIVIVLNKNRMVNSVQEVNNCIWRLGFLQLECYLTVPLGRRNY